MSSPINQTDSRGRDLELRAARDAGRMSPRQAVELRFDGVVDTVAALAARDGDELCISAPLALLRPGTGVRFRFENGPVFGGHVEDVSLGGRGDTPVLAARIAVGVTQRAAFRQQAPGLAVEGSTRHAGVTEVEPKAKIGARRRWFPAIRAGMYGFLCGFAVWGVETGIGSSGSTVSTGSKSHRAVSSIVGSVVSSGANREPVPPTSQWLSGGEHTSAIRNVGEQAVGVSVSSAGELGQAEESRAAAESSSPFREDLVIRRHGSTLELDLPATTAPRVSRHFRLARPPGVSIDTNKSLRLAPGKYPIYRNGILWLRVVDTTEGTRLRVFLRDRPQDYKIRELEQALGVAIVQK